MLALNEVPVSSILIMQVLSSRIAIADCDLINIKMYKIQNNFICKKYKKRNTGIGMNMCKQNTCSCIKATQLSSSVSFLIICTKKIISILIPVQIRPELLNFIFSIKHNCSINSNKRTGKTSWTV